MRRRRTQRCIEYAGKPAPASATPPPVLEVPSGQGAPSASQVKALLCLPADAKVAAEAIEGLVSVPLATLLVAAAVLLCCGACGGMGATLFSSQPPVPSCACRHPW